MQGAVGYSSLTPESGGGLVNSGKLPQVKLLGPAIRVDAQRFKERGALLAPSQRINEFFSPAVESATEHFKKPLFTIQP